MAEGCTEAIPVGPKQDGKQLEVGVLRRLRSQVARVGAIPSSWFILGVQGRQGARSPVRGAGVFASHAELCVESDWNSDPSAYLGAMNEDTFAGLADKLVDEAYATVKGFVRTYVMHQQLLEHLAPPPASVLDVGGGAGHQSFPLAEAGYDVTLLDPSRAMLDKAQERLERLSDDAQERVTLVQADGENAVDAVNGREFAAVLCHGVLGYLEHPEPLVNQLCQCAAAGGVVSIMAGNAKAAAVRPALERRWDDALAAFDSRSEIGVLGVQDRADAVEEVGELMQGQGVEPVRWYGVWLFVDWLEFGGTELDPGDAEQVAATAAVELEASRRDPYRQLSRVFHLVGRKGPS